VEECKICDSIETFAQLLNTAVRRAAVHRKVHTAVPSRAHHCHLLFLSVTNTNSGYNRFFLFFFFFPFPDLICTNLLKQKQEKKRDSNFQTSVVPIKCPTVFFHGGTIEYLDI
jgi:hypothetical protein